MKLLFYEPTHTGHHYPYLARMLPGFVELPIELILATSREGVESEPFAGNLAPFADRLTVVADCAPPPASKRRTAARRATEVVGLTRRLGVDHVLVLYADGLWQTMAVRRLRGAKLFDPGVTVEGIVYRGGFAYPEASGIGDRLKRWLFRRMMNQGIFDRLMIDDEILYGFAAAERRGPAETRVDLAANPVVLRPPRSRADARADLGLPAEGRIVSLSGMIDRRKGADRLIEAFARAVASDSDMSDVRLLLAGPHRPEIVELLGRADLRPLVDAGRIRRIDRFLDEADMFNVAAASDLVTAPYPNHSGRSSIILWAAAAGRPVLAVDRGCIAHVVKTERLGRTCDVRNIDAFAGAMTDALNRPWHSADAERSRQYAAFHDVTNYQRINSALVRRRLGLEHD